MMKWWTSKKLGSSTTHFLHQQHGHTGILTLVLVIQGSKPSRQGPLAWRLCCRRCASMEGVFLSTGSTSRKPKSKAGVGPILESDYTGLVLLLGQKIYIQRTTFQAIDYTSISTHWKPASQIHANTIYHYRHYLQNHHGILLSSPFSKPLQNHFIPLHLFKPAQKLAPTTTSLKKHQKNRPSNTHPPAKKTKGTGSCRCGRTRRGAPTPWSPSPSARPSSGVSEREAFSLERRDGGVFVCFCFFFWGGGESGFSAEESKKGIQKTCFELLLGGGWWF